MHTLFFLLLPLIGAIIGWLLFFAILQLGFPWYKKKYMPNFIGNLMFRLDLRKEISEKIDQIDIKSQIEPLLDVHLQELIATFKRQIPMASMFLTDSLTTKMKAQASEEMMKMVPKLKTKLIDFVATDSNIKKFLESTFVENAISFIFKEVTKKLSILGAMTGFLVALILIPLTIWITQR